MVIELLSVALLGISCEAPAVVPGHPALAMSCALSALSRPDLPSSIECSRSPGGHQRTCGSCKRTLEIACFYSKGDRWDNYCKPCRLKQKQRRRKQEERKKDGVVQVQFCGEPDRRHLSSKLVELVVSVMRSSDGKSGNQDRGEL